MSQDLKKLLGEVIEMHRAELCKMADLIYDFAEKSAEEYKSMELLTDYLQNEGFTVERGIALDTAFRATWDNCRAAVDDEGKNTAPVLGILVEYDALEDIGHACGHHMQGPAGIGAAIAIKDVMKDYPFKLVIYGTPAEETLGGKIVMFDAGYMKELDLALMSHGSPNTSVDEKCMALENFCCHVSRSKESCGYQSGRGQKCTGCSTFIISCYRDAS